MIAGLIRQTIRTCHMGHVRCGACSCCRCCGFGGCDCYACTAEHCPCPDLQTAAEPT